MLQFSCHGGIAFPQVTHIAIQLEHAVWLLSRRTLGNTKSTLNSASCDTSPKEGHYGLVARSM